MKEIQINYSLLNSHADYITHQRNTIIDGGNLIYEDEAISSLSLRLISMSSSRAASLEARIGKIKQVKGNEIVPFFLKKFTTIMSDILSNLIIRVDENADIIQINNLESIQENWKKLKGDMFGDNKYMSKEEKEALVAQSEELLFSEDRFLSFIKEIEPLNYVFADFYNERMKLNKKINLSPKIIESRVLDGFSLNMEYCTYLERVNEDKQECEISVYGLMNTKKIEYSLLERLVKEKLQIELEAYNYFIDLFYVVDIRTGLIKSMEAVVEESFNDILEYKIYYDINKL